MTREGGDFLGQRGGFIPGEGVKGREEREERGRVRSRAQKGEAAGTLNTLLDHYPRVRVEPLILPRHHPQTGINARCALFSTKTSIWSCLFTGL